MLNREFLGFMMFTRANILIIILHMFNDFGNPSYWSSFWLRYYALAL